MQKSVSRAQAPSGAQGTVEYLVIIAVVVVIGLVVAGLMMAMTGSSTGVSVSSSEIKGKLGVGGISVVDAVAGVDKNGLLVLKNIGSDLVTVNRIVVNDSNHNYSQSIAGGGQASFKLSNIVSCDGANKSYTVIVYYTSANDLNKTANFQTITVDCVPAVSSGNFVQEDKNGGGTNPTYVVTYFGNNNTGGSVPVDSNHYLAGVNVIVLGNTGGLTRTGYSFAGWNTLANGLGTSYAGGNSFSIGSSDVNLFAVWTDITAPVVFLLSPSDGNINSDSATRFDFNATDNNAVQSCSLKVNGTDVNTKSNPATVDYFTYRFSGRNDGLYNWGVSCTDGTNITLTSTRVVNIDLNNYQISYCQDLLDTNLDLNGNYVLMNDINCYNDTHNGGALYNAGLGFTPIGSSGSTFSGTFDGNNKLIAGLYINRPATNYIGLFGYTTGNISNVGVADANVSGNNYVGVLVGIQGAGTIISNSYSTGYVNGVGGDTGGLVGVNDGTIINSRSAVNVFGFTVVGGLAGGQDNGANISNSYSTGNVYGSAQTIGGLVGQSRALIVNSYSTGRVSSPSFAVGGLVGEQWAGTISSSYSTGDVNGVVGNVGGLVGTNWSAISNSYSTGKVSGAANLGGFIGWQANGAISNTYWDINRTGKAACCGLIESGRNCNSCYGKNSASLEPDAFFPKAGLSGDYNVPMQHNLVSLDDWTFGSDKNWTSRSGNYPILTWQTH